MQITFWRPCLWELMLFDVDDKKSADQSRFLEEVYTWESSESIWDSLEDARITYQLEELLIDGFSPDKSPDDRGITAFRNVLEQMQRIIIERKSEWRDCQQLDEKWEINLRANSLLSLLHHLTWLCDVFTDVPGISITVR